MKAMKFKVKNEAHNKAIQNRLFELGYKRECGKDFINTDANYLFAHDNGRLGFDFKSQSAYFDDHSSILTSLDDLYPEITPIQLKVESLDQEIILQEKGFKVGCQMITRKDAKTIAEFILNSLKDESDSN